MHPLTVVCTRPPPQAVSVDKDWHVTLLSNPELEGNTLAMQGALAAMARDPRFYKWRRAGALVFSRYMLALSGHSTLESRCDSTPQKLVLNFNTKGECSCMSAPPHSSTGFSNGALRQ